MAHFLLDFKFMRKQRPMNFDWDKYDKKFLKFEKCKNMTLKCFATFRYINKSFFSQFTVRKTLN